MIPQRTLAGPATIEGIGLHLGEKVRVELKPAPVSTGVVFVRTDLPGQPRIPANIAHLADEPRRTALRRGDAEVHTVEHLLACLWARGIRNAEILVDGPELPGLDGSARGFYEAILAAGLVEQDAQAECIEIVQPTMVGENGSHIVILPDADGFRVSYTLDYGSPSLPCQHLSLLLNEETFAQEIAPARTFCLEEEAEQLRAAGLGKGANTQNTLVLGRDGDVIENELRYPDEFVRHKILDLIGDLFLAGASVSGHVVATKSGHSLNARLARAIVAANEERETSLTGNGSGSGTKRREENLQEVAHGYTGPLDARMVERILPHRYPFLMVDKVLEVSEDGLFARAVKNVTINEEYFRGHFPGNPVMPGVLQIEGMAQTAGIMLRSHLQYCGKNAFLLSLDKVKFRRRIVPGDQIVWEARMKLMRPRTARVDVRATVDGQLAAEACIRFVLAADE